MADETVSVDVGPAKPLMPGGIASPKRLLERLRTRVKLPLPAAPAAKKTPWLKYGIIGAALFGGYTILRGGKKRHG